MRQRRFGGMDRSIGKDKEHGLEALRFWQVWEALGPFTGLTREKTQRVRPRVSPNPLGRPLAQRTFAIINECGFHRTGHSPS